MMTKEEATKRGKKLLGQLPKYWKLQLWENMGWHYKCVSEAGHWKIHGYGTVDNAVTAYLGSPDSPGGRYAAAGDTPAEAIKLVLEKLQEDLDRIQELKDAPR